MAKKEKTKTDPINKTDNKCSQYKCFKDNAVTVTLNHEEIGKYSEIIVKIKPFINEYNWEGIDFASEDDLKKLEKYNLTIALTVL